MKKRVSKNGELGRKSVLSSAIKDLESEIRKLNKDKSNFQKSLSDTSSAIDVDRDRERELQQKIAKLIDKEAKLNQKKKNLETKIEKLSDKIGKISKIKSEMADI